MYRLGILIIAFVCISNMHSVQSDLISLNPLLHSKWGIGACPKVTPMEDFDITKIYGDPWYLVVHYHDVRLIDRHCTRLIYGDANPGKDICRVSVQRMSTEYDDSEHRITQYFLLLPNETDHSTWIDTYRK